MTSQWTSSPDPRRGPHCVPGDGRHRNNADRRESGILVHGLATERRSSRDSGILRGLVLLAPAGFIAIEAGWIVTEVGRQPWIIQGVMRTEDAVTQVPNQFIALWGFTIIYVILAITLVWLLLLLAKTAASRSSTSEEVPDAS